MAHLPQAAKIGGSVKLKELSIVVTLLVVATLLMGFSCNANTTKRLAVASDAVSHALLDAQQAVNQGVNQGTITNGDANQFNTFLVQAAKTGLDLDKSIRAGETAGNVSAKVSVFLDAFNKLQVDGLAGIKNPQLKLSISTIITGAESAVAVIAASVGSQPSKPAPAPPTVSQ